MSRAQGGQAAPGSNCVGDQQVELDQLLRVEVDSELQGHQDQLKELIRLYNLPDTAPDKIEQFRRHAIALFVTPGLVFINRRMLEVLFSVSPFSPGQMTQAEYDASVTNFIDNKCLVALAELLTIPKLFMLVCELFLNFFYGKSKVRMAIAALNVSAHAGAAVSTAVPFVTTGVQGAGNALNIMFHLLQFVNNPAEFMRQMEGGYVKELLRSIPGGDSAMSACLYVFDTVKTIGAAALTPLFLVNIVSEAISRLLEYVSGLPAPEAPAAAHPAAAPNAPVSIVWRGGQWMLNGVGASIAYIRQHITKLFNPAVARLGEPENAYEHRLFTCMLNNLTLMSDNLNTQARVAFDQADADRVRATEVFKALVPSNYRRALEQGDMEAAKTERLMFLAALKYPVVQLCSKPIAIDQHTLSIIAPWVVGVGEITEKRLEDFVAQLPFPHYVEVEMPESMEGVASQTDPQVRDRQIQADFAKSLTTHEPLTPEDVEEQRRVGISFFGAPPAVARIAVRAARGFYDKYVAPPCSTMFSEFSSALHPGVRPNAVCRLGPLHPKKVIMSGVEHIVQKQISGTKLTNDEAILLNSYLNLWSGDPNMLSYGLRTYKDGRTEYCWFVYLGTTCYVLVDGQIERAHPNEVFDESTFGRAVRIVGDIAADCYAAAADRFVTSATAVADSGKRCISAVMSLVADDAEDDDNTFMLQAGPGGEFIAVPIPSPPQAAELSVPALHDAAADASVMVAVRDAVNDESDAVNDESDAAESGVVPAAKRPAADDDDDNGDDTPSASSASSKKPRSSDRRGGKSRRKSRKNSKKTTRRNKVRKSSNTAKKSQQQRARNSIRRRRSSRKGRK